MTIALRKFGTTLISRQTGREAYAALQPLLRNSGGDEELSVDFEGVLAFSPSWGDEFLTPLGRRYGARMTLHHTANSSVKATLELLQKTTGIIFKIAA